MSGKALTPYQGEDRVYGYFRCLKCKRSWESGNSWADLGQQCQRCKVNVYPHVQCPVKYKSKDEDPPHQQSLCEKCKSIGRDCSK